MTTEHAAQAPRLEFFKPGVRRDVVTLGPAATCLTMWVPQLGRSFPLIAPGGSEGEAILAAAFTGRGTNQTALGAYADWVVEQGNPTLAELIRVGTSFGRLDRRDFAPVLVRRREGERETSPLAVAVVRPGLLGMPAERGRMFTVRRDPTRRLHAQPLDQTQAPVFLPQPFDVLPSLVQWLKGGDA